MQVSDYQQIIHPHKSGHCEENRFYEIIFGSTQPQRTRPVISRGAVAVSARVDEMLQEIESRRLELVL
jgi:hypothetical protein